MEDPIFFIICVMWSIYLWLQFAVGPCHGNADSPDDSLWPISGLQSFHHIFGITAARLEA